MTQPTDTLLSVDDAVDIIARHCKALPSVNVPVASARGRTLRAQVLAERDQPPFDRATMDGIAVASDEVASQLRVTGIGAAGAPPVDYQGHGTCVEIMTGAVVPEGTDCVVPVERVERRGDQISVSADAVRAAGRFVHRRGSDHVEDAVLLEPGVVIDATHVAVLVSAGLGHVAVTQAPRISVIATGDELVDVDAPIAAHQIRRSNDYAAAALLERHGYHDVTRAHVADDRAALAATLTTALATDDVIVLSGGVSKGRYDFVGEVLGELNVTQQFHRIAQRPGKPMWFGTGPQGQLVFALPGNPVSALVCLRRYVIDALGKLEGRTTDRFEEFAVVDDMVQFKPDLTWFAAASRVRRRADATRRVAVKTTNTSGDFTALTYTDGFVELPRGRTEFERGYVARWFTW